MPRHSSACSRSCSSSSSDTGRIRLVFLSGLCAVLAYEARTAGIALLAAWVAESLLLRDYKRAAIAFVISIVPVVVSWIGWIKAVESSPEYQQPAYAYQRAPYLYFNVSYARNLMTLADPSTPDLGPLTTSLLLDRVRSNVKALPTSIGQAVSGWEAPARVALPLALLVGARHGSAGEAQAVSDADVRRAARSRRFA